MRRVCDKYMYHACTTLLEISETETQARNEGTFLSHTLSLTHSLLPLTCEHTRTHTLWHLLYVCMYVYIHV